MIFRLRRSPKVENNHNLIHVIFLKHLLLVLLIVSHTPQLLLLLKHPLRHTTHCLFMANQGLERLTYCTLLVLTQKSYMAAFEFAMYQVKNLPMTSLTQFVMIKPLLFSAATAI